jgi:hypothetical protein
VWRSPIAANTRGITVVVYAVNYVCNCQIIKKGETSVTSVGFITVQVCNLGKEALTCRQTL